MIIFSLYITIALDKLRMKDGINEKAESLIDTDFLIELRRNAYIECTENYLSTDTVAGIFGDELPEELFYACGVTPVPIEGVDAHIFKFAKENEAAGFCDVIKSTLIYLITQKCPILYSCKMYVLQNTCTRFIGALKANTEKTVYVYTDEEELVRTLCALYGTQYDETLRQNAKADLDYIKNVLTKIKYYSDVSAQEFFLLEFYSKYMTDLDKRRKYFERLEENIAFKKERLKVTEVSALCPRGNYKSVCAEIPSPLTRITRVWKGADYGYAHCMFAYKKETGY